MSYKVNEDYFDYIDSEDKAYWLGFLWCDGYVCKRIKNNNREEYNIKLSLHKNDSNHIVKFKNCINSEHPIKFYKSPSTYKNDYIESRIFITNAHLGKTLMMKYGLIPHRIDCSKLLEQVPNELAKHFIRGILDADGSLTKYITTDRNYKIVKISLSFTTYEGLLVYVEKILYNNNIIKSNTHKFYKRHKEENRDGVCRGLTFSGKAQAISILKFLYDDATIYLDRKYEKYKNITNNI